MNSYDLSRGWFDFCFENPEKIKPIHSAIYFFAIEHCNRLGWKEKFGFPSQMAMDIIGIKKHQTYSKALNELEEWGFISFIERSRNQYSANIISLNAMPKNGIAQGKALDKAFIKHRAKHGHSTGQGMDNINKQVNKETNKPINKKSKPKKEVPELEEFLLYCQKAIPDKFPALKFSIEAKYNSWKEADWKDGHGKAIKNWKNKIKSTIPYLKPFQSEYSQNNNHPKRERIIV